MVLAGTILTMVLSFVCVVVIAAAMNDAPSPAAKITCVAPAASAAGEFDTPANVAALR